MSIALEGTIEIVRANVKLVRTRLMWRLWFCYRWSGCSCGEIKKAEGLASAFLFYLIN